MAMAQPATHLVEGVSMDDEVMLEVGSTQGKHGRQAPQEEEVDGGLDDTSHSSPHHLLKTSQDTGEDDNVLSLNHALSTIHLLATEKNKLMEHLHQITDHLIEEKRKCEKLEAEMEETLEKYQAEPMEQQTKHLKDSLSSMMERLMCIKERYIEEQLPSVESEAHTLKTTMEEFYKKNISNVASYCKNLLQAQKQESLLIFKLWQIKDADSNTKNHSNQLKAKEFSVMIKMEGRQMLGQLLPKLVQEETEFARRNILEVSEACQVLSDA